MLTVGVVLNLRDLACAANEIAPYSKTRFQALTYRAGIRGQVCRWAQSLSARDETVPESLCGFRAVPLKEGVCVNCPRRQCGTVPSQARRCPHIYR